jgi:hypothetical protein
MASLSKPISSDSREHVHGLGGGHDLANQFQPLRFQKARHHGDAGDVAAGPCLTGSPSPMVNTIGIVDVAALAASAALLPPVCRDDDNVTRDQILGETQEPIVLPSRPSILDRDRVALDKTSLPKPALELGHVGAPCLGRGNVKESHQW